MGTAGLETKLAVSCGGNDREVYELFAVFFSFLDFDYEVVRLQVIFGKAYKAIHRDFSFFGFFFRILIIQLFFIEDSECHFVEWSN